MSVLLLVLACTASAEAPGETPRDLGDDPVFSGTVAFLDARAGEFYRAGLEHLRHRRYKEALASFRSGRGRARDPSEVDLFKRLVREAGAGVELEKIRRTSYRGSRKGARRALALIDRRLPDLEGLRLAREYASLRRELADFLFLVIEDFEKAPDAAGDGTGKGKGKGGGKKGAKGRKRGRGRLSRRLFEEALAGGTIQERSKSPAAVRQGERSLRWPVGKALRVKVFDIPPGALEKHRILDVSVRGSRDVTTRITVVIATDAATAARALFGGIRTGFTGSVPVRGTRWRDLRLQIGSDLRPRGDPDPAAMERLFLIVHGQPQQVLYLDDIKLER